MRRLAPCASVQSSVLANNSANKTKKEQTNRFTESVGVLGIAIGQNEQNKWFFLSTTSVSIFPLGYYFVRTHLTLDTLATLSKPFGGKHKKRVSVLDVRRV